MDDYVWHEYMGATPHRKMEYMGWIICTHFIGETMAKEGFCTVFTGRIDYSTRKSLCREIIRIWLKFIFFSAVKYL